jgi:hypothetical protein
LQQRMIFVVVNNKNLAPWDIGNKL